MQRVATLAVKKLTDVGSVDNDDREGLLPVELRKRPAARKASAVSEAPSNHVVMLAPLPASSCSGSAAPSAGAASAPVWCCRQFPQSCVQFSYCVTVVHTRDHLLAPSLIHDDTSCMAQVRFLKITRLQCASSNTFNGRGCRMDFRSRNEGQQDDQDWTFLWVIFVEELSW